MATKILIPTPLRAYTDKNEAVEVNGHNVGEVLQNLTSTYTDLKKHLYSDEGKLRSYVNIYVNDEDIRYLNREDTKISDDDVVSIVPSIAGGREPLETLVEEEVKLSNEEISRYSRHLIMPEIGLEGQKKLKSASVLIVGAGGLGSPLGMYLSAAGIGRLGIVDFDRVDESNLQRQLLFSQQDVGRSKLEAAKDRLTGINPHLQIDSHETRLTSENAMDIFKDYDVIVDGTDNFPTRYLVNDASVLLGKPNVYGSIFRFEGQVSVFYAKEGPCYRCLYPEPPPPGLVPSCAEGGVLGVLPGIIGSLQAMETIKLITGIGENLIGRLILFDALNLNFRELKLRKNPDCPVCGEKPTIHELIDYEEFCGVNFGEEEQKIESIEQISATELKQKFENNEDIFILDVREPHEYQISNLDGYLIPLHELPKRVHELDSSKEMVVHCRRGQRSAQAIEFLKKAGFSKTKNLAGGINAWAEHIEPEMPIY